MVQIYKYNGLKHIANSFAEPMALFLLKISKSDRGIASAHLVTTDFNPLKEKQTEIREP
jgi:hypothetical protein